MVPRASRSWLMERNGCMVRSGSGDLAIASGLDRNLSLILPSLPTAILT